VVLSFLAIAFGREYIGNLQIEHEILSLEAQQEALEGEGLEMLALIDQFSSEDYLEREARTKYGLGKKGETLVIVQEEEQVEDGGGEAEQIAALSNPERWYLYFFSPEAFHDLTGYAETVE